MTCSWLVILDTVPVCPPARSFAYCQMNDIARKPLSGLSLHLRSWAGVALPARELRENMDFGERINHILTISQIVLFCRRPRFSFDPDFSVDGERISGKLLCRVEGKIRTIPFSLVIPLGENEKSFVLAPAPHNEIHIVDGQGEPVGKLSAHTLSQRPEILKQEPWVNDLEVLYAGNVYKEGTLSAFEKVRSNKALQELLAGMRKALPDDDIIVYAFEYLPYDLIPMLGALMPQGLQAQDARFLSTKDHPLNEFQKTCMEQAALIEYFRPIWNAPDKQVNNPESERVFQSCEILDFSGVVIEISTVRSHFRLYSRTVPPMHHHMNILDLSDPVKRAEFFAIAL
ncbi:hypothetical protein BRW83_0623 [Oxalobacter formigenes]|nr:hypothetical protein BRW83_0623 [Oxalobacter formigenes]